MNGCVVCTETDRITRMETTLDDIHHRLFGNGQPGEIEEMKRRLDKLESWFWRAVGGAAVVLFIAERVWK